MAKLGDRLRWERIRRGLTTDEVARDLGLSQDLIDGIEAGTLPLVDAQAKAYVRMYARHLGEDSEALLRGLDNGRRVAEPLAPLPWHEEDAGEAIWRTRRPVLAGLAVLAAAVGFVAALVWGGSPTVGLTDAPPAADLADPEAPGDVEPGEPGEGEEPEPTAEGEPTNEPAATPVQVLHNNPDQAVIDEVVALLGEMGYPVEAVESAQPVFEETRVMFEEGWQDEAEALIARDPRFGQVVPNADFAAPVALHVAIGPDWGAEQ